MGAYLETVLNVVKNLPLKTGTEAFFQCTDRLGFNNKIEIAEQEKSQIQQDLKLGQTMARGAVTFVALSLFTKLGTIYNLSAAGLRAIEGTVVLIYNGFAWNKEVHKAYLAAAKHFNFAIFDISISLTYFYVFSLSYLCACIYALEPEFFTKIQAFLFGKEKIQSQQRLPQVQADAPKAQLPLMQERIQEPLSHVQNKEVQKKQPLPFLSRDNFDMVFDRLIDKAPKGIICFGIEFAYEILTGYKSTDSDNQPPKALAEVELAENI